MVYKVPVFGESRTTVYCHSTSRSKLPVVSEEIKQNSWNLYYPASLWPSSVIYSNGSIEVNENERTGIGSDRLKMQNAYWTSIHLEKLNISSYMELKHFRKLFCRQNLWKSSRGSVKWVGSVLSFYTLLICCLPYVSWVKHCSRNVGLNHAQNLIRS